MSERMERRRRAGSTGYVVVLLGAAAFVVGCFLPYYDYRVSPLGSASLYQLVTFPPGFLVDVGGVLSLFAGVATVAWVAMAGVRGDRGWTRPVLAAVVITWTLTRIGMILSVSGALPPLLMGYWILLVSTGVVVIGTIMVWVAARSVAAKVDAPLAS